MELKKIPLLLLVNLFFSLPSPANPKNIHDPQLVHTLFDKDVMHIITNYMEICRDYDPPLAHLADHFEDVCNVVIQSEVCQSVEDKKDLYQCRSIESVSSHDNLWPLIKGCAPGAFESVKDIVIFVGDLVNWIIFHTVTPKEWQN
ncbi:MAG: hypothetical protein OXB84_05730, partial [Halobacteriovoraceae bacterium]|nr:hypothetical protein [Halobacteriovoraceae bacterium]